ncbi:aminopeptidase P family protein [Myroides pelagicus]|uniref:aminopeptidase P family protein n=1 Tax=Myroides pelagicus TaxID=270914 RepID=UPI002DBAB4E3|nr:aminopeptidase P family protein [Myroides pelagicus]MEC4113512.1 aminopeptidase P family protein [Myroides pelagicus]
MTYLEKLSAIRLLMKEKGIDGYIIPSSDPHISEYLPDYYKCIAWTSGFTGSAGTLAITQDFAGLWTDSRYFVQAKEQLEDSGFELVKLKVQHAPEYVTWLGEQLPTGATVAFDGNLASLAVANAVKSTLEPIGVKVNGHVDLLDPIWKGRPSLPTEQAYTLPISTTGQSTTEKIAAVRQVLKQKRATAHLISSLDDLAWLFNIRGTDVKCNPVTLGFAFINESKAILFIDAVKLSQEVKAELASHGVEIKGYTEVQDYLKTLTASDVILLDPKRTCFATYDSVAKGTSILEDMNPSTMLKAIKNEVEINHQRKAMINDGVALTKFFKWIEENVASAELSEMSIADYLRDLRAEQPGFKDISFDTIAGYKDHGALPHYKAEPHSNYTLKPEGLLLVDSGGQYETGTTDITRVVSLGKLTQEEKEDYTITLKGTIEGSMAIYPKGTRGYQIDAITRRSIWATMRNYGHGTGHGVGFFLNVHEGPHVFNPTPTDIAIEVGMITSIEPGLYREGKHGIRIENLVLSKDLDTNQFGEFMDFETLTICYIATDLVDTSLLEKTHIEWLNNYNAWVYESLSPKLTQEEAIWLKDKTKAI